MNEFAQAFAQVDSKFVARKKQVKKPLNKYIGDSEQIKNIFKTWDLPQNYVKYLEKNLGEGKYFEGGVDEIIIAGTLHIYGAAAILPHQNGYSFKNKWGETTGEKIEDWPDNFLVIADDDADPYVLDLSHSNGVDAPILHAYHGQDDWDFDEIAESFEKFIQILESDPAIQEISME